MDEPVKKDTAKTEPAQHFALMDEPVKKDTTKTEPAKKFALMDEPVKKDSTCLLYTSISTEMFNDSLATLKYFMSSRNVEDTTVFLLTRKFSKDVYKRQLLRRLS